MAKQIKLRNAVSVQNELQLFLTEKGTPMATKIKARRTYNSFKEAIKLFYEERVALMKELGKETGEKDASGNSTYTFEKENLEKFNNQIEESLNTVIDIDIFLKLEDLEGIPDDSTNYYGETIDLLL